MDLPRTLTLLRAARWGGVIQEVLQPALDQLERGIAEVYALIIGDDPHPELSTAWGIGMTLDDLANHLGTPASWVTDEVLVRLKVEQQRSILEITV